MKPARRKAGSADLGEDAQVDRRSRSHHRFVLILLVLYLALWTALAIDPLYRDDWAIENIVVLVALLFLTLSWRYFEFSRLSYLLIAIFLALHAVGSHYTYSEVPYRDWIAALGPGHGDTENPGGRNHYDRFVHFAYGLLISYPFYESLIRVASFRRHCWKYLVSLSFVLSTSLIYEMLEWAAAVVLGSDLGMAFVGSQGDIWDAQKDSLCALLGALIALATTAIGRFLLRRDFSISPGTTVST